MKPRLLVLTSTFPRWQNDTDPPFVYELSRRLTDVFEVIIHTPHYPGAKSCEIMDGMWVHRFRYFFTSFEKLAGSTGILPTLGQNKLYYALIPFFLMAQFFSIVILVKKNRPDIIHAHWLIPQGFFAVIVGSFSRIPVVVTSHGTDVFALQGNFFRLIKYFVLRRAEIVTVVSKALADAVTSLSISSEKILIIPMGVNSRQFSQEKKHNILRRVYNIQGQFLLYVGRLTEQKGVHFLVDAMPEVHKKFPTAKLLIIGNGEMREKLKEQTVALDLVDTIHFVGSVPNTDLPAFYATADIFIGPSISSEGGDAEGFGLTFVEAAMSGCLVVGTKIGGIGDIIEDGKTGFLVPQKDALALADKIIFALSLDGNRRQKIQQTARRHCSKNFDWVVVAEKYKKLLLDSNVETK